jgi:hypothetical protein
MDNKTKKCAHPTCGGTAAADSDYCSAFCEGQAETTDNLCSCSYAGSSDNIPRIEAHPRV